MIELCIPFSGCSSLNGVTTWSSDVGTYRVAWDVLCVGTAGGVCGAARPGEEPRMSGWVTGIDLTVADDVPPLQPTAVTGTAIDNDGPRHGTESIEFDATDYESGVQTAYATLDGVEAGRWTSDAPSCHDEGNAAGVPDYTSFTPCAMTVRNVRLPLDTTKVPDGAHDLRVVLVDATGNARVVKSGRLTIDNVPAPSAKTPPTLSGPGFPNEMRPGDTITAKNGIWSTAALAFGYRWQRCDGANPWSDIADATGTSYTITKADIGKQIRVVVTGTNSDGSVDAASVGTGAVVSGATVSVASRAPTAEEATASSPQLVVDREQRSVGVRYGAKIVVTGRLVDADGAPIADADVDVFEQLSVVGAPWRKLSTIKTDSQGGYVFRPTTTGSRVLRFAYSASRDTGDYRATREVVIAVTAGMELRAVRRVIASQGVIRLRGRVVAEPLPKAGTWVEIQVLDAGVWRTIGTRKTSATGRWSFKHRVQHTAHVRFAFRARLRQLGDVPAVESTSSPVKVRVR